MPHLLRVTGHQQDVCVRDNTGDFISDACDQPSFTRVVI